jgi:lipopolysaccharide export system permease protein
MIKTYESYLIKLFLKKVLNISLIFLSLVIILSIFEEISFFKELDMKIIFPFFMTLLNAPATLFEIFPFVFLISGQFFFLDLINKNELEVFKIHSLDNLKIIKILFITSFIAGLFLISIYYSLSAKLKFVYLDLKNNYSNDNKYLAVVTETGLWVKDEIDDKFYIVNALEINDNLLNDVLISEFDKEFNLIKIISADEVNIKNSKWIIIDPIISKDNQSKKINSNITLKTHFNKKKINSLFSNLSSLNIFELVNLRKDYKSLGYSTIEIESQLNRIVSLPFYLSIMTLFSAVIMFNIKRNRPVIFHIILGIFLSVLIYYCYFLFNLLGESQKIPLLLSVWLPLLILSIIIFIGLIRINEK